MTTSETGFVKSCPKLESGLRLGQEGIHACQLGPFSSPIYWTAEEAAATTITREMIAEKRRWIFDLLNDDHSETPCKHCHMVVLKKPEEVRFDRLGHIDLAATTTCNLRCNFCGYTQFDSFAEAKYDALTVLRLFSPEDVVWDAAVDFNGGEPTLLKDFDDYIDYFASRRIRVFLYTNAVIYRQSVYDGLARGTIRWVCASLDAGTPSSYEKIKKSKRYADVLENIARYSHAGNQGGGQVSVKYIFSQDNCGDDDVAGFSYAMLAIRPQEVWLTFDFDPLCNLPGDCEDFGGHDYTGHIAAYAKTYLMLEKHGLEAIHFPEKHLAVVSLQGKVLLQSAKAEIERLRKERKNVEGHLLLEDFRESGNSVATGEVASFTVSPLRIRQSGQEWQTLSLAGKRLALAPACTLSRQLLASPELDGAEIVGFFDRDAVLHGKFVDGIKVSPYSALQGLSPDMVVVAAPEHHRYDIARTILAQLNDSTPVTIYQPDEYSIAR
ncbi:MAG: radical SAM protein [Sulfuricella denitrificans]|nr:radical SAM protein [Sulfuricella denitrificans]